MDRPIFRPPDISREAMGNTDTHRRAMSERFLTLLARPRRAWCLSETYIEGDEMGTRCLGLVLVVVFATLSACGSEDPAQRQLDCERLRDHAAAIAIQQRAASLPERQRRRHVAAMSAGLGDRYVERCEREMTEVERDCALAATTRDAIRSCHRTFASKSNRGGNR
jgi:hypothetical protein